MIDKTPFIIRFISVESNEKYAQLKKIAMIKTGFSDFYLANCIYNLRWHTKRVTDQQK